MADVTVGGGVDTTRVTTTDLSSVASVEDLHESARFAPIEAAVTISATTQVPILVAMTRMRITAAGLMLFNSAVVANDTNFWTAQLLRWRAGGSVTAASKNTKLTGNNASEAITQRQGWVFDSVSFVDANRILEPGDGLDLLLTPSGVPTALSNGLITVRYEAM